MEQATYGRMRLGKCVPDELAYSVGCSINVLPLVEMRCSGKRSCSGILKDLNAMGICESPVRNFLEASFSCVKGWVMVNFSFIIKNTYKDVLCRVLVINCYDGSRRVNAYKRSCADH
jgi:hypothetical protein